MASRIMKGNGRRILKQGLVAGMIGFATVVIVFALANAFAGRTPFYTAALLGASLFHGVNDPALVDAQPAYVLEYTALHLSVFIVFGIVASALAAWADRGWQLWYMALFLLIFVAFHLQTAVQLLAAPMQSMIPGFAIWAAGFTAAVVMTLYLLARHPRIRARQSW